MAQPVQWASVNAGSHSDGLDMISSVASPVSTRLRISLERPEPAPRHLEPVTAGIPLPRGECHDPSCVSIAGENGVPVPLQTRVLDRWADGSIRWLLLDTQLDHPGDYSLELAERPSPARWDRRLNVRRDSLKATIDTGPAAFEVSVASGTLMESRSDQSDPLGPARVAVTMTGASGRVLPVAFTDIAVEEEGLLRACIRLAGRVEVQPGVALTVVARLHFFAGSGVVRTALTVRNDRPARHAGGYWELGDPGSVLFKDFSVEVEFPKGSARAAFHLGAGTAVNLELPATLYQDSSGGENWRSTNHVNREGRIPVRFRGFELRSGDQRSRGDRATPIAWIGGADNRSIVAVTVRRFWQDFPKAIEAEDGRLSVRLFPHQFDDLHELQAGEQKTHVVGLGFGADRVGAFPLEWICHPATLSAAPEWYARCEVVPYLTGAATDPHGAYLRLVNAAIEGPDRFESKREIIDEYGWRNFGDLYADHEQAYYPGKAPITSHYNNQYDAVWGLACQFFRSGDHRWWQAMDELAAHVRDIDIYHTSGDKSAYNGGLFWHTDHYVDAGRSTHRAYPRTEGVSGGGPSNEQAYGSGLMLHYFLTGENDSREAALTLADWVVAMDDGRQTVFRWLSSGYTGLASATAATDYHGPGRGSGHAIAVLLSGFRLSGDRRYLEKAEALIRRCIHPEDDLEARQLLDVERRWSYTVFLQVLGRYLGEKASIKEIDERYAFAQAALLHYARWMADFEYPYLERPEILQYPTETWAAQDMRKSEVFRLAALHTRSDDDRRRFLERADYFFNASVSQLETMPSRVYTRPIVILLSCGLIHAPFAAGRLPPLLPQGPKSEFGAPERFVPQRTVAIRRAKWCAALGVVLTILVLALLLG